MRGQDVLWKWCVLIIKLISSKSRGRRTKWICMKPEATDPVCFIFLFGYLFFDLMAIKVCQAKNGLCIYFQASVVVVVVLLELYC